MTKSKAAITLPITEKIGFLETEIDNLRREVEQGEDALKLVQTPPRFAPAKGELPFFDRFNEMLEESKNEQERSHKIAVAQKAIAQSKQLLAEKQRELVAAKEDLERLKAEAVWAERYEPLIEQFKAGYVMPADQRKEIARLEGEIRDVEKLLFEMENIFDTGDSAAIKTWERKCPGFSPLKQAIPKQQDRIANLEKQLKQAKEIDEEDFRNFIREKVDIDEPLQTLLISQEAFTKAWQQFLKFAGDSPMLGIPVEELKKQKIPIVSAKDKIKIEIQNLA